MFGGTFVADGANFSNGSINAVRLDDSHDQIYGPGEYDMTVVAKFAAPEESVDFIYGRTGMDFWRMQNVSGFGYDITGTQGALINFNGHFRWALDDEKGMYTSQPSDNPNQQDAMITYRIKGESDKLVHYVLLFENLDPDKPGHKTRNDYNDLVLSVTKGLYQPVALPLPSAAYTGGAMLAAFLGLRVRRWVTSTA